MGVHCCLCANGTLPHWYSVLPLRQCHFNLNMLLEILKTYALLLLSRIQRSVSKEGDGRCFAQVTPPSYRNAKILDSKSNAFFRPSFFQTALFFSKIWLPFKENAITSCKDNRTYKKVGLRMVIYIPLGAWDLLETFKIVKSPSEIRRKTIFHQDLGSKDKGTGRLLTKICCRLTA